MSSVRKRECSMYVMPFRKETMRLWEHVCMRPTGACQRIMRYHVKNLTSLRQLLRSAV